MVQPDLHVQNIIRNVDSQPDQTPDNDAVDKNCWSKSKRTNRPFDIRTPQVKYPGKAENNTAYDPKNKDELCRCQKPFITSC